MECEEVVIRLWEYLDRELPLVEVDPVEVHLHQCTHCHSAYCCNRALLKLLARQRATCAAPPVLVASIRARLRLY
jgi:anti-sigma factor (TIGR02949 family)